MNIVRAADAAFYSENGYLVVQEFISIPEVERLRSGFDRIFAMTAGRERGDQFDLAGIDDETDSAKLPQILSPSSYAPELGEGEVREAASALIRRLLGDDGAIGGDHAILKPAEYGAETPWHQDEAYWDPNFDYNSLSIWIPLQEASLENGCMWFVPGSHRWEILEHQSIGNDPRIHGLEIVGRTFPEGVSCPIPAGGCTVHHSRTVHYAGPNRSKVDRRALIIGGGTPASVRSAPRSFPWNDRKITARQERAETFGANSQ